ncbi:MAG: adenylate/guanylate cyclase domain-containing protein [Rhodobacteraceae bacterium]|nr:adenylate/guanylate cyclase domain-containing protein [Paracoccaceae bacterium]PHR53573.1 MAG: hypothetical protein COA47_16810 [Robiginitomaculum sp.]
MTYFQLLGPFLLATFAISFLVVGRKFPRLHSAFYFAFCYASLALALTLDWTRDSFDPVLATYLTNIPYLTTAIFFAAGLFAINNRAVPWRKFAGFALGILVLMIWFRHIRPDLIWRTIIMTFGVSGIMLFGTIANLRDAKSQMVKAILWALAIYSLLSLGRTILALMVEADTLTVANYTNSIVAWTLQLSTAMSALAAAVLLFAHYGILIMRHLTDQAVQQQAIENQDAKYLSPSVKTDKLPVEKRPITALLVDLRGFTSYSDEHGSDAASKRANAFYALVTDEILKRNGTIDKYLGDAVLAFWNAPNVQENHADLAIETGLAIQVRLKAQPDLMEAVVTIESGECSVGNFGTEQRLDYTAIGGAMNIVARLEQVAKNRSIPILTGPGTAQIASHPVKEIAQISVAGIKNRIGIFVPLARDAPICP